MADLPRPDKDRGREEVQKQQELSSRSSSQGKMTPREQGERDIKEAALRQSSKTALEERLQFESIKRSLVEKGPLHLISKAAPSKSSDVTTVTTVSATGSVSKIEFLRNNPVDKGPSPDSQGVVVVTPEDVLQPYIGAVLQRENLSSHEITDSLLALRMPDHVTTEDVIKNLEASTSRILVDRHRRAEGNSSLQELIMNDIRETRRLADEACETLERPSNDEQVYGTITQLAAIARGWYRPEPSVMPEASGSRTDPAKRPSDKEKTSRDLATSLDAQGLGGRSDTTPKTPEGGTSSSDKKGKEKMAIDLATSQDTEGLGGRSDTTPRRGPEIRRVGPAMEPELLRMYKGVSELMQMQYEAFEDAQYPHIERSFYEIIHTAKVVWKPEAQNQTVVILGLDRGRDIPLKALARGFHHITIADINIDPVLKAIDDLDDENLRRKFTIIETDLTGILNEHSQSIKRAYDQYKESPNDFERELSHITNDIKKKVMEAPPDIGKGFDVALSQLVSSQLPAGLKYYIRTLEPSSDIIQTYDDFCESEEGKSLDNLMREAHMYLLARLVDRSDRSDRSEGIVHFADTYTRIINPDSSNPERQEILSDANIDPVLDEIFEKVRPPATWTFAQVLASKKQRSLKIEPQDFEVKSFSLRLKPSGDREVK